MCIYCLSDVFGWVKLSECEVGQFCWILGLGPPQLVDFTLTASGYIWPEVKSGIMCFLLSLLRKFPMAKLCGFLLKS